MEPAQVRRSSLAELAWVDRQGRPRATGIVALLRAGVPVAALTFDRAALAGELTETPEVVLVVREPRSTAAGWTPLAWACRPRLVPDPDGRIWLDDLSADELRRYPPARRYADSPLLRREHWWYLPRLIVELHPVEELSPPVPRADDREVTVVGPRAGRPSLSWARVEGWPVAPAGRRGTGGPPRALHPISGPSPRPGPVLLFGQDASFPDLEQWRQWDWAGTAGIESGRVVFEGEHPPPETGLGPVPTLWRRWRAERLLAAACRRGHAGWQHDTG